MSSYKFANNARAHLAEASGITATQTSCTLDDSSAFPDLNSGEVMHLTFDDGTNKEIIEVLTHDSANNAISMRRAQEGTVGRAWPNATTLSLRPTAEPFNHGIFGLDDNSVGAVTGSNALDLITYRYYQEEGASGADSMAFGNRPKAAAADSIAIGTNTSIEPDADSSIAIGEGAGANAGASYSLALGSYSQVNDRYSMALGYASYANAQYATAFGGGNVNTGATRGIAIGYSTYSKAIDAVALGYASSAEGIDSAALGPRSKTTGDETIAMGYYSIAGGDQSIAIGRSAVTSGNYGNIAIGEQATASGSTWSITIGAGLAKSTGSYSVALGYAADAGATNVIAVGHEAQSLAQDGVAVGLEANASGIASLAIGRNTEAEGEDSIAIGGRARTSVANSHNIGGLSIVKKYVNGYWEGSEVQHFTAQENILMSKDIMALPLGDNNLSISLPTNGQFFVNKVGVIVLEATGITTAPELSFGNLSSSEELLAQTVLTGMAIGKGYEFDVLSNDSQTVLTMSVKVSPVASSFRIRVWFKGFFIED